MGGPCLRCPRCGSTLGPGCDCWNRCSVCHNYKSQCTCRSTSYSIFGSDKKCPSCGHSNGHAFYCPEKFS